MAEGKRIDWICASEDGEVAWYPREVGRRAAARAYADECGVPRRLFRARRAHVREAIHGDCPAQRHVNDDDGDPDCICYMIDEGYWLDCEAEAPGAVPVWKVEERPYRWRRWLRDQVRRHLYPSTHIGEGRTVVWGGRVNRTATWLDQFLTGSMRGYTLHVGDNWVRLGEGELRWCRSCRATTPHYVSSYSGRADCEAVGHGKSKRAPLATDMRTNWDA